MTMNLVSLSERKINLSNKIVSPYSFLYQVGDALISRKPLSVVRMGDGEHTLLTEIVGADDLDAPPTSWDAGWHQRMGTVGITRRELYKRMLAAGNECSHFAPSVSGLVMESYNLFNFFDPRDHYVDNFFVNIWSLEQKVELFRAAQSVLFIHRNRSTADAMQRRAKQHLGVRVRYLELSTWEQTDDVIANALSCLQVDRPRSI
jgi:hypothetical protein